ncbi:MAG: alpha/beta fold hydrolase [Rhodocyclaceae bacterium]|nr:alpha/beta fold hydrolase [Rhodocyclaceae bacterium]
MRYAQPAWLPGPHLPTLWPLLRKPALPPFQRERWETPDGDFIDLDWLPAIPGKPLVVLFHGLEGSSRSHYARSVMAAARARGWNGVVPHFRGCSGEPNRLARAYHSGDSDEIDWILARCQVRAQGAPLFASGVSLGGNALLKWLGERGARAGETIAGAVAICPPLDLAISGHALARGFNRVYTQHFLATLKAKAEDKLQRGLGRFDIARIRRANTLYAFDDAYTGPLHGFDGADDYWRRASARPWLAHVRAPAVLLLADNDPFVPAAAWPAPDLGESTLQVRILRGGGHVGFTSGGFPGHQSWLGQQVIDACSVMGKFDIT